MICQNLELKVILKNLKDLFFGFYVNLYKNIIFC